ncbi:transporter substrate-binding domain-containing protein [Labrys wisconsinensis]|uniref:ABC-type amino acid transport substrate-binding protein n=1 Tax=Labrys wisconsinensis TaxID=425677 RepID=A0ABU0J9U1_9HYPH|nr:transporter substrate-binding domain-containing protein [Labrys wisconsinensis]MDQ0470054.1 ABC-type amino acid transport substrate-binding protein [Labrys wisconsinensis]
MDLVRKPAHRFAGASTGLGAFLLLLLACAVAQAAPDPTPPLRVGVYQVAPYGGRGDGGVFVGASVDLWRRVAEQLDWQYHLMPVSQMGDLLSGLEGGTYDVAIGAITITPERLARVDFSYPTHRSGVAVVFAKQTGAASALHDYGEAIGELGVLILAIVILLTIIGVLMWWFERSGRSDSESAVTSWHDGVYWAVVTMTTVGYGDKTPKTYLGRSLAVIWMVGSLVLVSLLTTNLVARITANRVESAAATRTGDLSGKRLAAVSDSSGAEYLDEEHLAYRKFADLAAALDALAAGKVDAVVNSIGALQYLVNTRFSDSIAPPRGVLAPAYMAFALPMNSRLKKPLDEVLTIVTASAEWQSVEETYFRPGK